ncbi:MAG: hypothetical protein QM784_00885 [Polyangiaceae bacterium]
MNPPEPTEAPFDLEPNEDVIERTTPDEPSQFFWVQTCPLPDCPCRTALVVAATDRPTLDRHAEVVSEAWEEAQDESAFCKCVKDALGDTEVIAFEVDIDSGDVSMPVSEETSLSPKVADVARLIDGDFLDRVASVWLLGKGQDDTSQVPIDPGDLKDYRVGQLLAWDEVYEGGRMDVYRIERGDDPLEVEAIDTYCVRAKCECNEVRIQFYELGKEEAGFIGTVAIKLEEPVSVALHAPEQNRETLDTFWDKYQKRNPNWVARLAHRADAMQSFGDRLDQLKRRPPRKWVSSSNKGRKPSRGH